MNNEQKIEKMVKEKGLNAPRLNPFDIDKAIEAGTVEYTKFATSTGSVLRWCIITLENGFSVTGKPSISISAENDDAEVGRKVALDNARRELWPLLGFAFKDRIYRAKIG